MPKKPNNATPYGSKPQDYVPKGNGDESGEYRPYGAGGGSRTTDPNNQGGGKFPKGFKDFKTPKKEEPPKEEPKKEQSKINPVERDKNNIDRISSQVGEDSEYKEIYKKAYDSGDENAKNTMTKLLDKGLKYYNTKTGCFVPSANIIYFQKEKVHLELKEIDNDVFWHETGHALDYALGNGKFISSNYKFDDNKTLSDTLEEEYDKGKIRKKILNDFTEEMNSIDSRLEIIGNEIRQKNKEWSTTEKGKEYAQLDKNYKTMTSDEKQRYLALSLDQEDYSRELRRERSKLLDEQSQLKYKWADISDQLRMGTNGIIGWGHKKSYFKNKIMAPTEFFAEYSSAKWRGDKEKLAKFNKYFPKTSAKMEKLLEMANKEF